MTEQEITRHAATTGRSDAEELRSKSLELLDFPAIRERVAGHTRFLPARKLAVELSPSFDVERVEELQRETAEGVSLLEEAGDVELYAAEDPSLAVERAALDGILTGLELIAVDASLEVQRRARAALTRMRHGAPTLARMAEGISDLGDLHRRIRASVGPRGDVLDEAAPDLRELRVRVREAYQRVTEALETVMHSPAGQEALQDQVVSVRGERLVVQVKRELRHRIPGIVHDASNTGVTLFVEPFATVEMCNAWRELALEEEWQTRRVLRELSRLVGEAADDIRRGAELTARLDFILARARYSAQLSGVAATPPARPAGGPDEETAPHILLTGARHPLLGDGAVPITVQVALETPVLVITGPNTGGKTVALKTVGLLALMHQSGLRIPARDGSRLPVFDGIYADVGDQQSIQGSVSTFGSHMRNVIDILRHASPRSLVLLDELGTSTDPEEGSALAKAILGHLASRGVVTIATTHHRTVAAHAEGTSGMTNASVDLDPATLRPTYHLTLGVPGRSYAMSVAAQFGVPEEIMAEAKSLLQPQYRRFEDWIKELQGERHRLKVRLREAEETLEQAEVTRRELETERRELAARRAEIVQAVRQELGAEYEQVRRMLRRARSALSWRASPEQVQQASLEVEAAKVELDTMERQVTPDPDASPPGPIAVGDVVDVRGLNVQGTVVSIAEEGGEVDVAVGKVRFRLDAQRLTVAGERQDPEAERPDSDVSYELGPILPAAELHIRGMRAEDAILQVEEFLDKALRDGLSSVRIIHGKGTGVLRQVVRELLESHSLVKSFAPEERSKGGSGATVVELV